MPRLPRLSRPTRDASARRSSATATVVILRMATLENAGPGAIAFLANPKYRAQLAATRAAAVIVAPEFAEADGRCPSS